MALNILENVRTLLRKGNDLHDAVHQVATRYKLPMQTKFDLMVHFL